MQSIDQWGRARSTVRTNRPVTLDADMRGADSISNVSPSGPQRNIGSFDGDTKLGVCDATMPTRSLRCGCARQVASQNELRHLGAGRLVARSVPALADQGKTLPDRPRPIMAAPQALSGRGLAGEGCLSIRLSMLLQHARFCWWERADMSQDARFHLAFMERVHVYIGSRSISH